MARIRCADRALTFVAIERERVGADRLAPEVFIKRSGQSPAFCSSLLRSRLADKRCNPRRRPVGRDDIGLHLHHGDRASRQVAIRVEDRIVESFQP